MKIAGWICAGLLLFGASWCRAQQLAGVQSAGAHAANRDAQLALALEREGKLSEAVVAWKKVVAAEPHNASAFAQLGLLEARRERYTEAVTYYRKARALQPGLPNLGLNLGLALFKSENFHDAAEVFEGELKKQPNGESTQRLTILAGMSEYAQRNYAVAAGYLKDASARDAQNLSLRLTLAHCYLWTKQFDATLAVYKEILALDPNSAEADMLAGEAMDGMHETDGAVQQFRAAVKANPKEPNVHFGLGYLLWTQKNFPDAIAEFNAELVNDPQSSASMIYLGDTYVRLNQFDEAKRVLEKAATLPGSDPLLHLDLGIVYTETGDKDAAAKELSQAVVMEPDNVTAHFRLAKLYQSMGKKEEAKVEFAKASSLNKKEDAGLYQRISNAAAGPARDSKSTTQDSPEKP
ncbi:tetratricopeptide repeat protein [Acidicapsa ligni]|uniref:tetratricopeptide repeat protein n=1 Tax=Acidicapsa ligni TaxID=542300 RepID=UPI0021E0FA26|nr:tetratricopeptide repeat protein [Acidicapsa ligni]